MYFFYGKRNTEIYFSPLCFINGTFKTESNISKFDLNRLTTSVLSVPHGISHA